MSTPTSQLVGISGTFASGKDTVAEYLVRDFGFVHASTSDLVREVALRERGSVERPVLREVAEGYRKAHGAGVFVDMALEKPRPLVVTGIRSLGEAKAITQAGGILLFVDAPVEVRYQRMKSRLRDDETQLSLDEFVKNEEKEMYGGPSDADFNLRGIKALADVTIENTMPLDDYIALAYQKLGLKP